MKILVVDDEPAVLEMYKLALEKNRHTTKALSEGQAAIAYAEEEQPDIIFLDIIMPNMNGLDILADLKKNSKTKNIPVYMLSNLPEATSGEKARELGAAGYLVKANVEPGMLAKILDEVGKTKK